MGSIMSAITGSGSKKAAGAQVAASQEAIKFQKESLAEQLKLGRESLGLQKEMFEQALSLGEPYRKTGNVALANYESLLYGIPVEETASYQSYGGGAAAPQSREDIYNELKDQYTTTTPAAASDMFVGPDGRVYNSEDMFANYIKERQRTGQSIDPGIIRPAEILYNSGDYEGMEQYGWRPFSTSSETSALDQEGLNAAVDQRLAEQEQGVLDSRDEAFSGVDTSEVASWQKSPGYEFRLGEGEKALERSAAARSGVLSGAQQKALQRYGQDYSTKEFNTYMDRLGGLINTGSANAGAGASLTQNSANAQSGVLNNMMNANQVSANNIGSLQTQIGAAQASGYLGEQQAGSGLLNLGMTAAGFFS